MADNNKYSRWIWRNIQIDLPTDWEMLQFSREKAQGRCAFADRYQFRIELDWCNVEKEPDLNRLISDYKAKMESEGSIENASTSKIAGWPGLLGRTNDQEMSRYGIYLPQGKYLVEIVFIWSDQREKELEKDILQSICYQPETDDGSQPWSCFGLHLLAPASHILEECNVQPAMAQLAFTSKNKPERFRVQRLGMVKQWLNEPLDAWLNSQADKFVTEAKITTECVNSKRITVMRGRYVPKGVLHANGYYLSACWISEKDERLYCVETIERKQPPKLEKLLTRCCDS